MAFELPPLPYAYDALMPSIDEETMQLHHDKHHAAYVNNLNAATEGTPFANMSIDELVRNLNMVPDDKRTAVRNNGGGHYNHSMFWEIMRPGGGGEPQGQIAQAINDSFGGFDALKTEFNKAGVGRFGSGWAWVIIGSDGKLAVVSTPEPGQPPDVRDRRDHRLPGIWQRRLGARLLPQVPEPPSRVSRGLVEHRQLGQDQRALQHRSRRHEPISEGDG